MSAVAAARRGQAKRSRTTLTAVGPPRRRHALAYALVLLLLSGAVIFATVALNALAAGDAVTARELEREVADAERGYERLLVEVARLEDPARIAAVATEELGMVSHREPRFLVLDRPLAEDATTVEEPGATDPIKPVLSVER